MVCVEAAGERAERRHDELGRRQHETAPRDAAAPQVHAQLGVEMAGDFGPRIVADGLVTEDDPAELDLVDEASATMIREARIMVADDPGPVEPAGQR